MKCYGAGEGNGADRLGKIMRLMARQMVIYQAGCISCYGTAFLVLAEQLLT